MHDVQYYVPIKLCRTVGGIHLFKIIGMLTPENVKLKKKINPKIRCIVKREPLLFHDMLKQGLTWFTLASNYPQETV